MLARGFDRDVGEDGSSPGVKEARGMRWAGYLVPARVLIGAGEEGEDTLVRVSETCFRWNVVAAVQAFGVDEVGEDVRRPPEDRPGGEEHV